MTAVTATPAAATRRRTRLRHFLPPQHGAWAMLVVPYLAALVVAGWRWLDLPLLLAWLSGYLLSYYALTAVKTHRPGRVRAQLITYAAVTVPLLAVVVAARPAVLRYAPAYALLAAVNVWYSHRRQERALVNDLASVVQACLMVFVVATVAGVAPARVVEVFVIMLAYFAGTVLYIKTVIRERENVRYHRASIGYHAAALATVGWYGVPVAMVFALLLARAALLAGRKLRPGRAGVVELFACALLLAAIALSRA